MSIPLDFGIGLGTVRIWGTDILRNRRILETETKKLRVIDALFSCVRLSARPSTDPSINLMRFENSFIISSGRSVMHEERRGEERAATRAS